MIQTINYIFTQIFDVILYPFNFLPEFWGVLFLSILMSFVVLIIYKYASSPSGIKDAKDKIKANILAIRIYRDFWKVILVSFFKSLFYTFKYFFLNFGPVLLILPILFPAFVQMDIRYGMRPYKVGEEVIIKTAFAENPAQHDVQLMSSDFVAPKMKPVVINAFKDEKKQEPIREVNWKVKALENGETKISIQVDGKTIEKSLVVGEYRGALSNWKSSESSWAHFINPAEKLIDGGVGVETVTIRYPGKEISFLGLEMHWIIYNLLLVVIVVLAFRKRFGVEF